MTYYDTDTIVINKATTNLIRLVSQHLDEKEINLVSRAADFAIDAHTGQKRLSGEPYIIHPIAVALALAKIKMDVTTIVVALLHDVVEDTVVSLKKIRKKFGITIAEMVKSSTKINKFDRHNTSDKQAHNMRRLLLATAKDPRVILVKLADRTHNMETLHHIKNIDKRKRIAQETLDVYAPIAARLGVHEFGNKLQDLSFSELFPSISNSINQRLTSLRRDGIIKIHLMIQELQSLLDRNDVAVVVDGREKTLYSIWKKMLNKNLSFDQLSDIFAFRIITQNVPDCYRALGTIHTQYHIVQSAFHDYISIPKDNGYQSIHTVIMQGNNKPIEIQIRTQAMHEVAEIGLAAHWQYKESGPSLKNEISLFKQLRDSIHSIVDDPKDMLESTMIEMSYNQIFCFSPTGELISLPEHSIALDFAFAIHSDLGIACAAVKINGQVSSIYTKLENGDQVKVISTNEPQAHKEWLNVVVSAKAKNVLQRYLHNKDKSEYLNLGRSKLIQHLTHLKIPYNEQKLIPLLDPLQKKDVYDLLSAIGEGCIDIKDIIELLSPKDARKYRLLNLLSFRRKKPKQLFSCITNPIAHPKDSNYIIPHTSKLHIAHCCFPLPGEAILGVILEDYGTDIHSVNCGSISGSIPGYFKMLEMTWSKGQNGTYITRIMLKIAHIVGSVASVVLTIAEHKINIRNIKIINSSKDFCDLVLDLEVKGLQQVNAIISVLHDINTVQDIKRVREIADHTEREYHFV